MKEIDNFSPSKLSPSASEETPNGSQYMRTPILDLVFGSGGKREEERGSLVIGFCVAAMDQSHI